MLDLPTLSQPPIRCSRSDPRVLRAAIERRLKALLPAHQHGNALTQAMRHALLAPGKRVRPLLTALATRELGGDALDALDAGCALEMVHAASLVLDDLPAMDDAASRRGQPSTHAAFGEDVAILAAVTLLSAAYGVIARAGRLTAETRCTLAAILSRAIGIEGMAAGQLQDLKAGPGAQAAAILDANHLKTGALFVAAVDMAGVIARADARRLDGLRLFGVYLGQAFQLLDDLADGPGGAGAAEIDGKATLLLLLGRDETRRTLARHLEQAFAPLKPEGELARFVSELFEARGAGPVSSNGSPRSDA